jgi:hypothetical protein
MVDKLAQQANPPFTEPQILLRNGQMLMYGKITRGWFTANMLITMNVGVDELTGQPKIEIASADFGPFPAPEGLTAAMSAIIAEAFTGSFGPVAVGFRLESIAITDSIMTLTGRNKKRSDYTRHAPPQTQTAPVSCAAYIFHADIRLPFTATR